MTTAKKMIEKIPDTFSKKEESNTYKAFKLIGGEIDKLKDTLDEILAKMYDIDKSEGQQLDRIGMNLQEYRAGKNDVNYRLYLKAKQIANLSRGEIESLNKALELLMGDAFQGLTESKVKDIVFLDGDYNLDGQFTLNGAVYEGGAERPATVEVEYDHEKLMKRIKQFYEELDNDPWFLDGSFKLDGERHLDGGIQYDAEQRLSDQEQTINEIRNMMDMVKAGGVTLLWVALPTDIKTKLAFQHDMKRKVELPGFESWELDGAYSLNGTKLLNAGEVRRGNQFVFIQDVEKTVIEAETEDSFFDGTADFDGTAYFDGKIIKE